MTARLRRVINHTLRLLNQFDREHLNKENNDVLNALFDYLENEKESENWKMKNRFYGVFNTTQQDSDETKTFKEARNWLKTHLRMGDVGTIYTCEYLDADTYEYKVLQIKEYKNILGKITLTKKEVARVWN